MDLQYDINTVAVPVLLEQWVQTLRWHNAALRQPDVRCPVSVVIDGIERQCTNAVSVLVVRESTRRIESALYYDHDSAFRLPYETERLTDVLWWAHDQGLPL